MPELPEIHLASQFINRFSSGKYYRSPIIKSAVSKMKDLIWSSTKFTVHATPRGKELQVKLTDVSDGIADSSNESAKTLLLTFQFGMSGKFSSNRFDEIPKHAHLQFFTTEAPAHVLSFVDYRRFGKWEARDFDVKRSPDPVLSPKEFRRKVLTSLDKAAFNKAICDVIMDQEYFNGIGNYLRAEIIFRTKIPPFTQARGILADLPLEHEIDPEHPDILDLCSIVPKEVFGFTKPPEGYNAQSDTDIYIPFKTWLRCYMKPEMNNLVDKSSRTIWFAGPAGPMAPGKKVSRHGGKKRKNESPGDIPLQDGETDDELALQSGETDVTPTLPVPKKKKVKTTSAVNNVSEGKEPSKKKRKGADKIAESTIKIENAPGSSAVQSCRGKKESDGNVMCADLRGEVKQELQEAVSSGEKARGGRTRTKKGGAIMETDSRDSLSKTGKPKSIPDEPLRRSTRIKPTSTK